MIVNLLVLLAVLAISCAQDLIKVPMKIGEDFEFEINLLPTVDGVRAITEQFCTERKADFGITDDNLTACLDPVSEYLYQYIPQAAKAQQTEPEFTLPLKVGELEFEISIQPNAESAIATALAFCQQHGGKFGVTEETFTDSCLNPVGDYLKSAAEVEANTRNERRRKLADMEDRARQLALEPDDIVVPMKIGDALAYNISWNSKRTDAKNMAIKFCTEQGEAINAGFEDCLEPVEAHLTEQAAQQMTRNQAEPKITDNDNEVRIVKAKVDIAGEEFEFRFEPAESDALRVASEFCLDKGLTLGVNEDTVEMQCIKPILRVLLAALEQVK